MNQLVALIKREPILTVGAAGIAAITIYNGIIAGHTSSTVVNDVIIAVSAWIGRSQVSPTSGPTDVPPPAK